MSHAPYTPEEYKKNVSAIWKTTAILTVVTFVEVGVAVLMHLPYAVLAAFVSLVSIVKAFYIMNVFMHLGHETKAFKYIILFPFVFLIWAFVAFSLEGLSWASMRDAINMIWLN